MPMIVPTDAELDALSQATGARLLAALAADLMEEVARLRRQLRLLD